ncbi:MAG: 16S rRNA (cytosine(1402)-N(4))-methyltransferase RsmH [Candidatus Omnitrophica bacterium]|nr:16S rRNA (cytosine(1402)-N(4))-methyltransferase RsmH [Candidatus Omnitrophota bacterium]MBU4488619.1 16S rRNA (cytosine(1402)-N(4))-methyltransferase RsmH [Candidatus Omnitrophota bacterium]MCG2705902.1 16S rRNA (cytosine(1402)-N(4))-methyltransferase RsmH [Candidatus Omnitrophota bacterium]
MNTKMTHIPVLLEETIGYLNLKKGMVILDCTVGMGGHAKEVLEKIGDTGHLIGIDRDEDVLNEAKEILGKTAGGFKLFHSNYKDLDFVLRAAGVEELDGALFDLGVSSFQLISAERGFSIKSDGPLDMRMDKREPLKASDIINRYSKYELIDLFKKYGDEYFAGRIVERIIRAREREKIATTGQLAEIVEKAFPYKYRFRRIHPATKVFMALRIAVNDELQNFETGLSKIIPFLKKKARLCVISFHSIEDRTVKNAFKELEKLEIFKIITKKPVQPSEEEIINNPRARSAKLRVAERT